MTPVLKENRLEAPGAAQGCFRRFMPCPFEIQEVGVSLSVLYGQGQAGMSVASRLKYMFNGEMSRSVASKGTIRGRT